MQKSTSALTPLARAAALLSATFLTVAVVTATEPIVFQPAYAPGPADNPLKGFVPYAGEGRDFPHSLEFGYLSLASMMTGPTTFNWVPMERLLDGIASRGCQGVFRIYMEYPRKPSGVPEYLVQAGVKVRAWNNTNTQPLPPALDHTPDYEDPRLREALKNFIAALGARYDGDPRIGFITAGLLGTWGEWHCHPHAEWFASRTVQAEVMDAYEAAFKRTPVLLRYPAGDTDPARASNGQRNLGYHDDSFAWSTIETGDKDDDWTYLAALRKAGPAAMERWRSAPIGGEIRPGTLAVPVEKRELRRRPGFRAMRPRNTRHLAHGIEHVQPARARRAGARARGGAKLGIRIAGRESDGGVVGSRS